MKQSLQIALLLVVIITTAGVKAYAQQDPYYPLVVAELQISGGDTLPDGFINSSEATMFDTHLLISLYDTIDISKIHVVLRRVENGPDLLVQSFDFSAVQRNEFIADLALGSFPGMQLCYGEAKIERADGSLSETFIIRK